MEPEGSYNSRKRTEADNSWKSVQEEFKEASNKQCQGVLRSQQGQGSGKGH